MKTKQPLGPQIDAMLKQGIPSRVIAERLGCRLKYVYEIKSNDGFRGLLERKKRVPSYLALRSQAGQRWALRRAKINAQHAPIIAAVDRGLSYTQVAQKFGLKSRSVVAGIVNRRPESHA